jgi:hypothetical protein
MTMNLSREVGYDATTVKTGRPIVTRLVLKSISILYVVARALAREVAAVVRQDIANGRIERTREDWER